MPEPSIISLSILTAVRDLKPADLSQLDPKAYADFSKSLIHLLKDNRPLRRSLSKVGEAGVISFADNRNVTTERKELVPAETSEVTLMQNAHANVVKDVATISLPYVAGSRGIVSTAGGALLPIFVLSLRMLRRTGSTLPVELFLRSDEDHGQYLCDEVLPALNARCIVLDDFFDKAKAPRIQRYQYKIFSILFSSFEEVLMLDADSFPVQDPRSAFDAEPFLSSGLVTWPDFWISTTSEKFYQIQGTEVPPTNLRASTEAGQVMVSRRTHAAALLVTAYYNYWGPTHYYPLLTQGGPGEGDKETFLAGAAAVGSPFYQVNEPVGILGYTEHGELHGIAMLQHDPVGDFDEVAIPAPFCIHSNFPKLDPNRLFTSDSPVIDRLTGNHHRLWGTEEWALKTFGKDVERGLWAELHHVACNLGGVFADWKAILPSATDKGTCKKIEEHMDLVFPFREGEM